MTDEAAEPEVAATPAPAVPAPSPQAMPPLQIPPELQQQLSQDILNALGADIGALRGQLIVNEKQWQMEKSILLSQISTLHQQLQEAGVVPKSVGEPGEQAGDGAAVTQIRQGAKKKPAAKKRK